MTGTTEIDALDRHALVCAVWLPAGLLATTLFHYGLGRGGSVAILLAFGLILCAFVGHVIANVLHGVLFSGRERGLGLVLYAAALISFGFATLIDKDFAHHAFAPTSVGFLVLFGAVALTATLRSGLRGAFESFDVSRSSPAAVKSDE